MLIIYDFHFVRHRTQKRSIGVGFGGAIRRTQTLNMAEDSKQDYISVSFIAFVSFLSRHVFDFPFLKASPMTQELIANILRHCHRSETEGTEI